MIVMKEHTRAQNQKLHGPFIFEWADIVVLIEFQNIYHIAALTIFVQLTFAPYVACMNSLFGSNFWRVLIIKARIVMPDFYAIVQRDITFDQ